MSTKPLFSAAQFADTPGASARAKATFANRFVRFVEGGMDPAEFSEALYGRLMYMFGHIAHYNRQGFAATWFGTTTDKVGFLKTILHWPGGGTSWGDVEKALSAWVRGEGLVEKWRAILAAEAERSERELLAQLLAKYGTPNAAAVIGEPAETVPNDDGSARRFFLTTYTVKVLSAHEPATGLGVGALAWEILDGPSLGDVDDDGGRRVTAAEAARLSVEFGSDPSWFDLDEDDANAEESEPQLSGS